MKRDNLQYSSDLLFAVKHEKHLMHHVLLYLIVLFIVLFLIFIVYAQIDERVKGSGKVVPKTRVVNIQSLDGGVIDRVYRFEGDVVTKGERLVALNPLRDESNRQEFLVQLHAQQAQKVRLIQEIDYKLDQNITLVFDENITQYGQLQLDIFNQRIVELHHQMDALNHQKDQKKSQLHNLVIKVEQLQKSIELLKKELSIKKELHRIKALSVDVVYRMERELNDMVASLESSQESIIEIQSALQEMESKYREHLATFRLRAIEELAKVDATIEQLQAKMVGEGDRVSRTLLVSPVNGIIKNVYFSHHNEVVKNAEVIMDILPTDDRLLIEAKISPKDIAFIAIEQQARVNITAYDFSIYGGLDGKVIEIGADSLLDKATNEYYYLVKILTSSNYLMGKHGEQLKIMPGMVADVNIITGKKSIFDFIFKPIIKTYKNALHER
ncbi:MAG: hypothetical protein KU38_10620 [Sulfurovum sp. FS08-3]|nr:MAG: hypothetical protein KU38_10620 [Sulfurovum sp. FS08-3]